MTSIHHALMTWGGMLNGVNKGSKAVEAEQNLKNKRLSSTVVCNPTTRRGAESLVIARSECCGEYVPGLGTHRPGHTMGAGKCPGSQ